MDEDQLTRDLVDARDALAPADQMAGRHAVERRVRRHQLQRAAAAVAIVVVVLGGAALGLSRSGSEDQGLITTPAEQPAVPHLIPRDLPDGWTVTEMSDFSAMDAEMRMTDPAIVEAYAVWTDGPVDAPAPGVGVIGMSAVSGVEPRDGIGDALEISTGAVTVRAELQDGDRYWSILGRGVDEQVVRDLADQIRGSGGEELATALPSPPVGFREVVSGGPFEASSLFGMEQFASEGTIDGYGLQTAFDQDRSFLDEDAAGTSPGLIVMRGGPTSDWFGYAGGSEPLGVTEVQGRRATLWQLMGETCTGAGSAPAPAEGSAGPVFADDSCERVPVGFSLTIEWTDGIVVSVFGGTEDAVRRIADGLEEVDDAAWQQYVDSLPGPPEPAPVAPRAEGGAFEGQGTPIDPETGAPIPSTSVPDDTFDDVAPTTVTAGADAGPLAPDPSG